MDVLKRLKGYEGLDRTKDRCRNPNITTAEAITLANEFARLRNELEETKRQRDGFYDLYMADPQLGEAKAKITQLESAYESLTASSKSWGVLMHQYQEKIERLDKVAEAAKEYFRLGDKYGPAVKQKLGEALRNLERIPDASMKG